MFGSLSFAAWGFGTLGRVRSLGVRIFGLHCLGIRKFGSAVFWLAGYLGVRYFGWSPFSGCLDPWASLHGGSEFWVYGILASWVFGPGSAHLDLRLSVWLFVAGRMVLRFFLGSHGTLVAVSAPLLMPLRDSRHSNECSLYVL